MKTDMQVIPLKNSDKDNIIIGQAHFIKTIEDVYQIMAGSVPGAQFGAAFNEASGPRLIRRVGTNEELIEEATRIAELIGAGHLLVIVMRDMFPINVLPQLKQVPEVVRFFCATANPAEAVVVSTKQGRALIGVVDGGSPMGIETEKDVHERKEFLKKIGYTS